MNLAWPTLLFFLFSVTAVYATPSDELDFDPPEPTPRVTTDWIKLSDSDRPADYDISYVRTLQGKYTCTYSVTEPTPEQRAAGVSVFHLSLSVLSIELSTPEEPVFVMSLSWALGFREVTHQGVEYLQAVRHFQGFWSHWRAFYDRCGLPDGEEAVLYMLNP